MNTSTVVKWEELFQAPLVQVKVKVPLIFPIDNFR